MDWLDLLTEPSEEEGLPLSRLREFIRELDDGQEDIDPCEYFTTYEMEPADLEGDWDLDVYKRQGQRHGAVLYR